MGGEPKDNDGNLAQNQGLSPRGRGTRWERTREVVSSGSIPAWAGNPEWRRKCTREGAVYPRVGGEPILRRAERRGRKGLSPRGRGTRLLQPVGGAQGRSIPAWAGNPPRRSIRRCRSGVYPRVGGEPSYSLSGTGSPNGLSPRGRGTPDRISFPPAYTRSIPAWAGNPPRHRSRAIRGMVYPRVGGEPTSPRRLYQTCSGLSPRGRGTRQPDAAHHRERRSIPAWAGNPQRPAAGPRPSQVYPRVGGEPT